MKPEENIKKYIKNKKPHVVACDNFDKRVLDDSFEAMQNAMRGKTVVNQPHIWRIIMKSRITQLAVAAIIIMAVIIGVNWFGGSFDMAGVAWANVAKKVQEVHDYVYRMRETMTSSLEGQRFEFVTETQRIVYSSSKYGNKTEFYKNGELMTYCLVLRQEKEFIGISPAAKEYQRYPLSEAQISELDKMNPRKIVARFMSSDYKSLGLETINGIRVEGVEVDNADVAFDNSPSMESFTARLWVDVETYLPIWLEVEYTPRGETAKTKIVIDEFIWDVKFDAGDFAPDIPEDYKYRGKPGFAADQKQQTDNVTQFSIEPYLSEYENMDLPDIEHLNLLGLEDDEPKMDIKLVEHIEVWKAQDDFIRNWPPYSKVRSKLYQELLEKSDIENLSIEQLVATGLALREKFWQKGGCLSNVSYPFGYASRILFETAHEKEPQNMDITDELVESILSVELVWQYEKDSEQVIKNPCYQNILTELRLCQFRQIKNEIEQGKTASWKDFVRINDLAILLGDNNDYESALEVVDWLILHAQPGRWTAYLEPLKNMHKHYTDRQGYRYNIFVQTKPDAFPEEFRHFRRLPSFQGPDRKSRGIIPAHIQNPNPVWTGQ